MRWILDKEHTWVGFTVQHLLVSTVRGRFTDYDAEIVIDTDEPERSHAVARIVAASIETGNATRDAAIRSPDILDVARFADINFQSTQAARIGVDSFWLRGLLTLHGVTREVVVSGRILWPLADTASTERAVMSLRTEIDRHEFGIEANSLMGARIAVGIDAELTTEPESAPSDP